MRPFREGQRVSYVGDGDHGLQPGDRGKVLSAEADSAHVLWTTGRQAGNLLFHDNYDLVAEGAGRDSTHTIDSFHEPLVSTAVRSTFDRYGSAGLLNALNEEGHLAVFAPIAEEAIQMVAARIREEPAFQEVLAHLDPQEGDEVVSVAAFVLLRDAFGEEAT